MSSHYLSFYQNYYLKNCPLKFEIGHKNIIFYTLGGFFCCSFCFELVTKFILKRIFFLQKCNDLQSFVGSCGVEIFFSVGRYIFYALTQRQTSGCCVVQRLVHQLNGKKKFFFFMNFCKMFEVNFFKKKKKFWEEIVLLNCI